MKMGFWRIRVAGEKTEKGYQTEVRMALTEEAFILPEEYLSSRDKKRIDLWPDHPVNVLIRWFLEAMKRWPKSDCSSSSDKTEDNQGVV